MIGLQPNSAEAQEWVEENVQVEGWNWLGGAFWGEGRYMAVIVDGMMEAGLENETDFLVTFG